MRSKKFLIALSVLVLFFVLIIGIPLIIGPKQVTEKTVEMLNTIETSFSAIAEKLPNEGEEVEFVTKDALDNLGFIKGGYSEYNVFICEEDQFRAMANGAYNSDSLEGYYSMSSGKFEYLDTSYFKERSNYHDFEYEKDLRILYNAKTVGIFRTEDKFIGKWEGEYILERAWWNGWFFLVDLPTKEIIGCARIEIIGGDEAWDWEGDGMDPLEDDLHNRVISRANTYVNNWCGTKSWGYFDYFKPEELKNQ